VHPGEVITLYGTGFGPVTPLPSDGAPTVDFPASTMDTTPFVAISGQNATVQFAGLSRGFVGRYQFTVVVPDGLGSGDLPVLIAVDGETSNIVSIPVRGQPGIQSELIRNGDFATPLAGNWFFAVSQGAVATVDQPPSSGYDGKASAHISITTAGVANGGSPAFTAATFGQFPIPLTQDALYQLQFWAKSSSTRNARYGVFRFGASGTYTSGLTTFSVGTNWQHFVTYFQATRSGTDGQINFFLGDQAGEVWFAGVSLIAVRPPISSFTIGDRGGASVVSTGTASGITVGYGVVQPIGGSTSPSGLAIFGFRQNNVLLTEAGVPASTRLLSGRIYADVNGPVNTGVAIANPNNHSAAISFYFTDSSGNNLGNGSTMITANGQIANFLTDSPFNMPSSFNGTFTFSSSVPIAVIALRGFTNERNEFLITTLPVADLSVTSGTDPVVFPHFADGGGWTTQIVLVNPGDSALSGTVQFRDTSGRNTSLRVGNLLSNSFSYTVAARSSQKFETAGAGSSTISGSVRVVPSTGTAAPSGLAIFSFRNGGITVSQAGVPAVPPSKPLVKVQPSTPPIMGVIPNAVSPAAFRLYAEAAGDPDLISPGLIQTGVAITNNSSSTATVALELFKFDGSLAGTGNLSIPANGQTATFLNQIPGLASVRPPFQGILRVSSTASISVVGLRGRYNERSDFLITTVAATEEGAPASTSALYFPHLVDGGGYTTQLILLGATASQSESVNVVFVKQDGSPFTLSVKQVPDP
jgi:hypothetical protein